MTITDRKLYQKQSTVCDVSRDAMQALMAVAFIITGCCCCLCCCWCCCCCCGKCSSHDDEFDVEIPPDFDADETASDNAAFYSVSTVFLISILIKRIIILCALTVNLLGGYLACLSLYSYSRMFHVVQSYDHDQLRLLCTQMRREQRVAVYLQLRWQRYY